MKPPNQDEEEIREALRSAFPKIDTGLERDLWPVMLGRLQMSGPRVTWYDWALAAGVVVTVLFLPKLFLMCAYYL